MWFSTTKIASSHCLVSRPSILSKCIFPGLGLMLAITAGSFSLGYIFITSMLLIVYTVYFTLISSSNPKECTPNYEEEEGCSGPKEEVAERVAELVVADKGVFQIHEQIIQGQEAYGSMHRALNYLATISENKSAGDDDDDEQCITTSEDDENGCEENVARSSLSSEDDGSISDEDTLIEIEIPTGHYLSPIELQHHKLNSKHKVPDSYSCTRPEPRWMEMLSEANNELSTEEDNLIEIDISVGSIMCPRFEIQA